MITSTATNKTTIPDALHPLIRERQSPRIFSDRSIGEGEMESLLEAVRWAASSRNEQPWRLIYAHRGTEAYRQIMDCLSEFNRQWAGNAPLLMLTAYKEQFSSGKDNFHALHDLGLALGNLTFQAQSMEIALHHMAGVDWRKVQRIFDVPAGFHVTTAIAVGYYGGDLKQLSDSLQKSETAPRERMPTNAFAAEGHWPGNE